MVSVQALTPNRDNGLLENGAVVGGAWQVGNEALIAISGVLTGSRFETQQRG